MHDLRIQASKTSDVSSLGLAATESFPAVFKNCNYISGIYNFGLQGLSYIEY
jgi:hypothetical protein